MVGVYWLSLSAASLLSLDWRSSTTPHIINWLSLYWEGLYLCCCFSFASCFIIGWLNASAKNRGIKAVSVSGAERKNMTGTVAFAVDATKHIPCWMNTTIGTAASASGAANQAITTGETDAFASDAKRQTNTDRRKPMNGMAASVVGAVKKGILNMTGTVVPVASAAKQSPICRMNTTTGTAASASGAANQAIMTGTVASVRAVVRNGTRGMIGTAVSVASAVKKGTLNMIGMAASACVAKLRGMYGCIQVQE